MENMNSNNKQVFISLVKAGLWADNESMDLWIQGFADSVDWDEIYQLAEEQSVIGLALAGIDYFNIKPPQKLLLQWIGEVQIIEQQNKAMNKFIAELIEKMRDADIYALLVKGQGVAQCYERPFWRACGDVDLLLSADNYEKAKTFLTPFAEHVDPEERVMKHLGMTIGEWIVELHGTMYTEISRRVNKGIDAAQNDCLYGGNVRSWNNDGTTIILPSPDNDVILVFTHILEHFFVEGVGLRQVCDWCRLLYTYKDSLNYGLLESRIKQMGLMRVWKSFATLAVDILGMPKEAMPMYDTRYKVKGERVLERILKSGNMGHNNDLSYRAKYSGLTYKIVAAWRRLKDFASLIPVFPLDAPKFFFTYLFNKAKS